MEEYDGEKVDSAKGPAAIGSRTTVASTGAPVGCRAATSARASVGTASAGAPIASIGAATVTTAIGAATAAAAATREAPWHGRRQA